MTDKSFLDWPFFDDGHRAFAARVEAFAAAEVAALSDHHDVDGSCRALVAALGKAGLLTAAVPASHGGLHERLDVRTLCIARETLARHGGLADFAFAMQGLGTGSITLAGSDALKDRYLPPVARGEKIAAFRALRTCRRLGRCGPCDCRGSRRAGPCAHHRREDLDLQWRHRRPLCGLCPHRRGSGRTWSLRVHGGCRCRRLLGEGTHRHGRSASSCDTVLRRCARARLGAASARAARASRWRWRRSTSSVPPSARPRSALPAGRSTRRWSTPPRASSSARRLPTFR